jgi:pantoate--beta-alanine ligase
MKVLENIEETYATVAALRRARRSVGLVPTMGALHEGHYSLVRRSTSQCEATVATIFVNPTQFGPKEDYSRYPRTLDEDLAGLERCGADFVFIPRKEEIYGLRHSTWIEASEVAIPLEGRFRPGHYRGVATIVLKLFNIVPADIAFFGRKDYQQLLVIKRMVEDLNVPIRIEGCPTVREIDGLAMSSRNRYLSTEDRKKALAINQALRQAATAYRSGEVDIARLHEILKRRLNESGVTEIDYAQVVSADTLLPISVADDHSIAMIAARVGNTRLIDNMTMAED